MTTSSRTADLPEPPRSRPPLRTHVGSGGPHRTAPVVEALLVGLAVAAVLVACSSTPEFDREAAVGRVVDATGGVVDRSQAGCYVDQVTAELGTGPLAEGAEPQPEQLRRLTSIKVDCFGVENIGATTSVSSDPPTSVDGAIAEPMAYGDDARARRAVGPVRSGQRAGVRPALRPGADQLRSTRSSPAPAVVAPRSCTARTCTAPRRPSHPDRGEGRPRWPPGPSGSVGRVLLSDEPGWFARAQARRSFCPADAPWVAVAECGGPHHLTELARLMDSDLPQRMWKESKLAANNYLRGTGLATAPAWIYGTGHRAIWPDRPGRWFVAHASTPEITEAARRVLAGQPVPAEPPVSHYFLNGLPSQLIARSVGEPAPTQGDVLVAALLLTGLPPELCYAATSFGRPTNARSNDVSILTVDDDGFVLGAPVEWLAACDGFRACEPHPVPPGVDVVGPAGPIRVVRLGWGAMHDRAGAGDAEVPRSPIELAVAFVEVAGIHPHECWGIAERQPGTEPRSAFAQVVFRPRPEHDDGARFGAYLASLGLAPC